MTGLGMHIWCVIFCYNQTPPPSKRGSHCHPLPSPDSLSVFSEQCWGSRSHNFSSEQTDTPSLRRSHPIGWAKSQWPRPWFMNMQWDFERFSPSSHFFFWLGVRGDRRHVGLFISVLNTSMIRHWIHCNMHAYLYFYNSRVKALQTVFRWYGRQRRPLIVLVWQSWCGGGELLGAH